MTNSALRPADFKCSLRAQGHRPQRMQVYRLGKSPARKVYRVANGGDLVGKELWLELEELNGPRTLKYRFVAGGQVAGSAGRGLRRPVLAMETSKPEDSSPAEPNDKRPPLASAKS